MYTHVYYCVRAVLFLKNVLVPSSALVSCRRRLLLYKYDAHDKKVYFTWYEMDGVNVNRGNDECLFSCTKYLLLWKWKKKIWTIFQRNFTPITRKTEKFTNIEVSTRPSTRAKCVVYTATQWWQPKIVVPMTCL